MNKDLALLYELQLVDSGIAERQRTMAELDDGSQAEAELAQAEKELAEAEKKLREDHTTLRDKELRLASTEAERADKHDKCYGGQVTDPKELAALEQKIEELTALKDKLEEEILLLMDVVEEEESQVEQLRQRVQRMKEQVEDKKAHHRMETERLQREIADLQAQREELVGKIDATLLRTYEQLKQKLGGVAVAAVVNYTCSACHTAVPRDVADRIPNSEVPIRCENCHRILWRPD